MGSAQDDGQFSVFAPQKAENVALLASPALRPRPPAE